MSVRKYYDLGDFEDNIIRMSDASLSRILRALIRCRGIMTSSCEFEGHYKNSNMNTVVFRIKLPENNKDVFEQITGFKLTEPEVVTGQDNNDE